MLPTSPEIKRWRRIWWGFFGVMIATTVLVEFVPALKASATAQRLGLAILMGAFVTSMYIELGIIRKLRNELIAEQKRAKGKQRS